MQTVLESGSVRVGWQSSPAKIQVGEPFELVVSVCPKGALLRKVDASMPLHRHGMNYRPSIHPVGEGRWQVQGMVWHMSGMWQLAFSVALPGGGQTGSMILSQDVMLH